VGLDLVMARKASRKRVGGAVSEATTWWAMTVAEFK
jgi:hypothetical protein